MRGARSQTGAALIVALMAMALVMAVGAGLILASSAETTIAANYRAAAGALYAADAILDRTLGELGATADWTDVPSGGIVSTFLDGGTGVRVLVDRQRLDLAQVLSLANCQKPTPCAAADLDLVTAQRPWGALNPRWRFYAHGRLAALAGGADVDWPFYVVSLVADDPMETDGDPDHDGLSPGPPNPGRQVLVVRAEAFGPRSAHKVLEATIARIDTVPPTLVLRSRREVQ